MSVSAINQLGRIDPAYRIVKMISCLNLDKWTILESIGLSEPLYDYNIVTGEKVSLV